MNPDSDPDQVQYFLWKFVKYITLEDLFDLYRTLFISVSNPHSVNPNPVPVRIFVMEI